MYDIYVNVNIYNVTLNVSNTDVNDMPNMHTKCNMLKKKKSKTVLQLVITFLVRLLFHYITIHSPFLGLYFSDRGLPN